MQVGVGVFRHVVVEDDVDTLDVHATTEQVGGDEDALLEVLELLVTAQTTHTRTVHATYKQILDNSPNELK